MMVAGWGWGWFGAEGVLGLWEIATMAFVSNRETSDLLLIYFKY